MLSVDLVTLSIYKLKTVLDTALSHVKATTSSITAFTKFKMAAKCGMLEVTSMQVHTEDLYKILVDLISNYIFERFLAVDCLVLLMKTYASLLICCFAGALIFIELMTLTCSLEKYSINLEIASATYQIQSHFCLFHHHSSLRVYLFWAPRVL